MNKIILPTYEVSKDLLCVCSVRSLNRDPKTTFILAVFDIDAVHINKMVLTMNFLPQVMQDLDGKAYSNTYVFTNYNEQYY